MKRVHLPEKHVHGRRLGRHVAHDPRSLERPAAMADEIVTVRHERRIPIFDQGSVGACTGMAECGMLCTGPFGHEDLTEQDAIDLYSEATKLDDVLGTYPPIDTGSNGLAIMKAAQARGWLASYAHAFGLEHALRALVLKPAIVGIEWREGCDDPSAQGIVRLEGASRGGHEVCLVGIDAEAKLVWAANSWGTAYGLQGFFAMSFDDFGEALAARGDVTFAEPLP